MPFDAGSERFVWPWPRDVDLGQTILLPYLQGIVFLLYWFLCFAFTFAAIFIACLDLRAVLRRIRNEQPS